MDSGKSANIRLYLYISQDLISLLDAGMSADHPSVIIDAEAMFNEDMFGYSQSRYCIYTYKSILMLQMFKLFPPKYFLLVKKKQFKCLYIVTIFLTQTINLYIKKF